MSATARQARIRAVDPLLQPADADCERMQNYLRRLLAEGGLSPSRERMVRAELRKWERR